MSIRNRYRGQFALLLISFVIISCSSNDQRLKAYFADNTKLHQELSDSLMNFCKKYQREITLERTQFPDQHIRLDIYFPERAELLPIFFDTSYERRDYSEKTSEFVVPVEIIEKFDKSIYFGIGSDSSYTFFVYEWNKPGNLIGTSGDSQYGVLVLKDTVDTNKWGKRISTNACIASRGVF